MLKFHSEQGEISVSSAVFSNITGMAATNCFGVKGMAYRSMTDGLVHLLRREAMSKGVNVIYNEDESISIELHIIVENGVNIPTAPGSRPPAVPDPVSPRKKVPASVGGTGADPRSGSALCG